MNTRSPDSLVILVLYAGVWALVNLPLLASPLGSYPVVDAEWHHQWALKVSEGDPFLYAPYFRAPLYPWVLGGWYALAGSSALSGSLLSMLFGAGSAVWLYRLVLRGSTRGAALTAASLWCLWGPAQIFSGLLLMETMYIFLLITSLHLLCRKPDTPLPWLVLGAACIARPGAVLLLPVGIHLFQPRFRSWIAWALPVAAVWIVNGVHGDFGTIISSQGGINFHIGSGPRADGFTAFAPQGGRSPGGDLPYVDNVWASSLGPLPPGTSPSRVSSYWTRSTLEYVLARPERLPGLLGRKILYLLSPVEIPCNYDVYYLGRHSSGARLLMPGTLPFFPLLLLWALLPGALLAGRPTVFEKRTAAWVGTLALGLLPFFITARFRLPMIPFLLALLVPRFFRTWKKGLLTAPLGIAAGIALALHTAPVVERSGVNMPFHDGMAHYRQGHRAAARLLLMEAWERASRRTDGVDLNGTDALHNLGLMAVQDGDPAEALFWFEKALEWNPGHEPSREALAVLTGMGP